MIQFSLPLSMKLEPAERPTKLAIGNDVPSSVVSDETPVNQFNLHICAVSQVLFIAIVQNSFLCLCKDLIQLD